MSQQRMKHVLGCCLGKIIVFYLMELDRDEIYMKN
jgi:hypothetical protein